MYTQVIAKAIPYSNGSKNAAWVRLMPKPGQKKLDVIVVHLKGGSEYDKERAHEIEAIVSGYKKEVEQLTDEDVNIVFCGDLNTYDDMTDALRSIFKDEKEMKRIHRAAHSGREQVDQLYTNATYSKKNAYLYTKSNYSDHWHLDVRLKFPA